MCCTPFPGAQSSSNFPITYASASTDVGVSVQQLSVIKDVLQNYDAAAQVVDFDGPTVAMHAAFGAVAPGDTQVLLSDALRILESFCEKSPQCA